MRLNLKDQHSQENQFVSRSYPIHLFQKALILCAGLHLELNDVLPKPLRFILTCEGACEVSAIYLRLNLLI